MKKSDAAVAAKLLQSLLALAKLSTMQTQYVRLCPGPDGRIRTTLSVVGTETGRLSSSGSFLEVSTNLQNISKKVAMLDPLYDARVCFIPDPGCVFIEADLKQAEVFATAAFCGDDDRLARLHAGEDAHNQTASMMFGVPVDEVNKRERQIGKLSHALHYGQGWRGLMEKVNANVDITGYTLDAAEARSAYDTFHALNPLIKPWHDDCERELNAKGYWVNPFGRRRDFFGRKGHGTLKEYIANKPQGTIADHVNNRLNEVYDREGRGHFELNLQVHDSLLLQTEIARAKAVAALVKSVIETTIEINFRQVRIPCEVSMSEVSWADMEAL